MAMYKILGDDGNEYGPVDARQVKTWIKENRLERKTPVFPEGAKDWIFLGSLPEFARAFPPQMVGTNPPIIVANSKGGLNALIPYKNPSALVAYYLGVFAVIPVIGIVLGFLALTLGVLGLRFRRRQPAAGGAVHAWIGILVGGFFGTFWLAGVIVIFFLKSKTH